MGHAARRPDPSDMRAKLIVPRPPALDAIRIVHEAGADFDRDLRHRLGSRGHAGLVAALQAVAPDAPIQPRILWTR